MSLSFSKNINILKNAAQQTESFVLCKNDSLTSKVLDVLWAQGFILGYRLLTVNGSTHSKRKISLQVFLKFWGSKPVLQNLRQVSRPQKRIFLKWEALTRIYNKHELIILSTSQGVLSHHDCLKARVGGEILCIIA